ncbi:hypothetical protein IC582_012054 [Cucumis melo]
MNWAPGWLVFADNCVSYVPYCTTQPKEAKQEIGIFWSRLAFNPCDIQITHLDLSLHSPTL